jgi:hypothetical protein
VPKPEDIKLYQPYNNRECLHCHLGARRYEEASEHHKDPKILAQAASGTLKDATFWSPSK